MRRIRTIGLTVALFVVAHTATAGSVSVLFVGNSLIYTNDLPTVFKKFAAASPSHVQVETISITPGGAFLYDHWKHGQAANLMHDKRPNFVVLQGQSLEPVIASQSFSQSAARLKAEADQVGAKTVLFSTWARPGNDAFYKEARSGGSPAAMQARLDVVYATVAKDIGATLAPIGVAFSRARQIDPEVRLLDGTQHPAPAGTYLAAAVLFRTMFGDSPVGVNYYEGLPKETAISLQRIAEEVTASPSS